MSDEPDLIPLSALQHWAYCPRQCGLIHLEQAFDDNIHTMRGNAVHSKVDQPGVETVKGVRIERALPLWHEQLGLIGKSDVVEFASGAAPYPVEYKHGNRNKAPAIAACDDLQLAAQALCLESMMNVSIDEGALFYATSKRRRTVPITQTLRDEVSATTSAVRAMLGSNQLPPPLVGDAATLRCKNCSLHDRCQPEATVSPALREARSSLFDPEG